MSEAKLHRGGCHCGRVRYEATLDTANAITCNCSICQKTGTMLAFTPDDQFKLLAGEDALVDYLFNRKAIHHYFCGVCGVRSFARGTAPDGRQMAAVNVRCLDDVDLAAITPKHIDGRSF